MRVIRVLFTTGDFFCRSPSSVNPSESPAEFRAGHEPITVAADTPQKARFSESSLQKPMKSID
jgi:hypothetical protein